MITTLMSYDNINAAAQCSKLIQLFPNHPLFMIIKMILWNKVRLYKNTCISRCRYELLSLNPFKVIFDPCFNSSWIAMKVIHIKLKRYNAYNEGQVKFFIAKPFPHINASFWRLLYKLKLKLKYKMFPLTQRI